MALLRRLKGFTNISISNTNKVTPSQLSLPDLVKLTQLKLHKEAACDTLPLQLKPLLCHLPCLTQLETLHICQLCLEEDCAADLASSLKQLPTLKVPHAFAV